MINTESYMSPCHYFTVEPICTSVFPDSFSLLLVHFFFYYPFFFGSKCTWRVLSLYANALTACVGFTGGAHAWTK